MRPSLIAFSLTGTLLAGCAQESRMPPVSTSNPASLTGAASQMPQAPNSLPLGSAVNAPLDPPEGIVGRTQVTPNAYRPLRAQ